MFQVLCQQLRDTLTTAFQRHLTVEDLQTWINIRANSSLGKHETKIDEGT